MRNKIDYARTRVATLLSEAAPTRRSEYEIQAHLFAGEYGTRWRTTEGEEVEIIHFGEWNHEAGPDFKGARIRFGNVERTGDLELDMDARDWERHGHATNPAFAGVLLQFFVHRGHAAAFARTCDHRAIPQVQLSLDKPSPAVSYRTPADTVDPSTASIMLREAAEFRLRSKHSAYARSVSLHGPESTLFYAVATGLGYKNNAIPFLLTAQRIGLRNASAADGEARLFGAAGFLEPRTFDQADSITRNYLKPLWDNWWALRDGMSRLVLAREAWKFSGVRPANHPHRRMGTLAAVGRDFGRLRRAIRQEGMKGFQKFFTSLVHPYWTKHWNLSAARLDKDMALIGNDRVLDLLINAYLPSLPLDRAREEFATLPGPAPSRRVRKACEWLLGFQDPKFMRTALHQQGLLQLFLDFGSITALETWDKIQSGSTTANNAC